jgi:predicted deacylase
MEMIEVVQFRSLRPGPRLIVTGAVHGNEVCGTEAIRAVAADFRAGRRQLARGIVTFVPICNPVAYAKRQREGDRNLNRDFRPAVHVETAEDRIVNHLAPLLGAHDVLVDLHSFASQGEAFVLVGPSDNDDELEPFHHEAAEGALALAMGPNRIVYGWLPTYAKGVVRRASGSIAYGIGTTEYMRHCGGYAVTVECGQHADPRAPAVARAAIDNALVLLQLESGSADRPLPERGRQIERIALCDVHDRLHPQDRLATAWRSFDRLASGQAIAWRADGTAIAAPEDGYVVFPNADAVVGREWFYFARRGDRRFVHHRH